MCRMRFSLLLWLRWLLRCCRLARLCYLLRPRLLSCFRCYWLWYRSLLNWLLRRCVLSRIIPRLRCCVLPRLSCCALLRCWLLNRLLLLYRSLLLYRRLLLLSKRVNRWLLWCCARESWLLCWRTCTERVSYCCLSTH